MKNSNNQDKRGPGGDGGDIFIFAREIKGNGKIVADGGDGSIGGKGGKIHIVTEKNNYSGEISAKGGKSDQVMEKETPGLISKLTNNQTFATIFGGLILLVILWGLYMLLGINLSQFT